jgi:hypothetical protein
MLVETGNEAESNHYFSDLFSVFSGFVSFPVRGYPCSLEAIRHGLVAYVSPRLGAFWEFKLGGSDDEPDVVEV